MGHCIEERFGGGERATDARLRSLFWSKSHFSLVSPSKSLFEGHLAFFSVLCMGPFWQTHKGAWESPQSISEALSGLSLTTPSCLARKVGSTP